MSVVVLLVSWAVISIVAGLWLSAEARKAADQRGEQDAAFTELLASVAADIYAPHPKYDVYEFCRSFPRYTSAAYRFALQIVAESHGNADAKQLALALGRMQCAQASDGRRVAIHDDQMIQDDIDAQISDTRTGKRLVR